LRGGPAESLRRFASLEAAVGIFGCRPQIPAGWLYVRERLRAFALRCLAEPASNLRATPENPE